MLTRISLMIAGVLFCIQTSAQNHFNDNQIAGRNVPDSAAVNSDFKKVLLNTMQGKKFDLINGREYFPYYYRSELKPILFLEKQVTASIVFSGRNYDNIVLQYDTFTDEVIFSDLKNEFNLGQYKISLNRDEISRFILYFDDDTLDFWFLSGSSTPGFNLEDGFYEKAYCGESEFIIKHRSVIHERNGIDEYFYTPVWYVNSGGNYHGFRSSKQFTAIFDARQDEMKKLIGQKGINIRKAGKGQIISILRQFDSSGE